jgi:hypothetical protein
MILRVVFPKHGFFNALLNELRTQRRSGRKGAGARSTSMFAGDNFAVRGNPHSILMGWNGYHQNEQ